MKCGVCEQELDNTNFDDVGDFHEKFGLNNVTHQGVGQKPENITPELLQFRIRFMREELEEFLEAAGFYEDYVGHIQKAKGSRVNHAKAFDALIDLVYVAMGTAQMMGYPWQEGWNLVQKANMAKERALNAADSKRGSTFDVVKPKGWTAPDITGLLKRLGWSS